MKYLISLFLILIENCKFKFKDIILYNLLSLIFLYETKINLIYLIVFFDYKIITNAYLFIYIYLNLNLIKLLMLPFIISTNINNINIKHIHLIIYINFMFEFSSLNQYYKNILYINKFLKFVYFIIF